MSVQSVERTFSIIEYLSSKAEPQQLAAIGKACGLAPATTHRLLETLCGLGYVKNENSGTYTLTPKLFSITSNRFTDNTLISIAKPYLEELSNLVNESVHLVLRDGCDVVYVYKVVKTIGSIQMASHIGMRIPMYRTAVGKAILSTLPDQEVRQIFQDSDIHSVTKNTITNIDELLRCLEITREQGYGLDNEENEMGITCIAMPLGHSGKSARYAFSISSLTPRMMPERLSNLAVEIKKTQQKILSDLIPI